MRSELARSLLKQLRNSLAPVTLLLLGVTGCTERPSSQLDAVPRDRLPPQVQRALDALPEVTAVYSGKRGNVVGVTGRLGRDINQVAAVFGLSPDNLKPRTAIKSAANGLVQDDAGVVEDGGTLDGGTPDGGDDPTIEFDEEALGACETIDQTYSGYPIEGGECKLCRNPDGEIIDFYCDEIQNPPPPIATISADAARATALAAQPLRSGDAGEPQLTYFVSSEREDEGATQSWFAWKVSVQGGIESPDTDEDGFPSDEEYFIDANTGEIVADNTNIQPFRARIIFSSFNRWILPGLYRGQGPFYPPNAIIIPDPDPLVNTAYINSGWAYAFYRGAFGRFSFDNLGADMIATVRYGVSYSNAFWNMRQTVFGDGNGVTSLPLVLGREIVIHEWTHAVTQYTARLAYRNESGALNEAWSDIMGVTGKAWSGQGLSWAVGGTVFVTPRRMDNPTLDGQSRDFYAERYRGTSDNGGVHINSGIANLAYYLIVSGGNHPRPIHAGVPVQAQGLEKGARIFYRAYRYMNASCNFRCARRATMRAAEQLYGAATATEVGKAWTLVGVAP
jgi:Zn-dependent metalloprotease